MPIKILLKTVILLFCHTVFSQTAVEKKILNTELYRFSLMVEKDTHLLRTYLDEDLYYLHSNGLTENKQAHLAAISSGTIVYEHMRREPEVHIRRYGKIALVNSRVNVDGLYKGKRFSVLLQYTATYRKQNRRWRLLNWQSTRIQTE